MTKFIVFSRKGFDTKAKKSVIFKYLKKENIKFLKNLKIDISSSQLRSKLIDGSKKIKELIETTLSKNKANNIVIIDLRRKSYIADYMIIASGTSSRHLQSLSENLIIELKKCGVDNCKIEGYESTDWKLVDAIDIIVHLFHPEKRSFYDLEKMWSEDLPREKALI